ncbi:LOW QUALITY PROTEIN: putative cleavage and polyadenylation specificity factor subunit 4-like protein [Pterocles gutturalis]
MQELVAGVEKLRFDLEADMEQPQGISLWPYTQVGKFWPKMLMVLRVHHSLDAFSCPSCTWEGLNPSRAPRPRQCPGDAPCTPRVLQISSTPRKAPAGMSQSKEWRDAGAGAGVQAGLGGLRWGSCGVQAGSDSGSVLRPGTRCPFRRVGGERTAVCRHWLRGLCKKGDGCEFLHESDAARVPQCCFYSQFGECSSEDCPLLHTDGTASTVGCPWYDRGFCRHGPLCRYKHTRRVMCANYLVGFCPEGPKCKFMHLKAGLMTSSTDPSKGAGCPQGLARLDLTAGEESDCKDVPPTEPPLPVTCATQHLPAPLWDTDSGPPSPQSLLERGSCFECGQQGHYGSEILLGK